MNQKKNYLYYLNFNNLDISNNNNNSIMNMNMNINSIDQKNNISNEKAIENNNSNNNIIKNNHCLKKNITENKNIQDKNDIIKKEENIDEEEITNNIKEKEKISKNKINNPIYNMILLHTGNFALSLKEAIEIYDFRKLNLLDKKNIIYNHNQIKENNCLLQRINLLRGKKINYVFEFSDKTLLCATYSKIFRLKLINNDLSHNILGIIKLGNSELPTQLISLGDSLLVILSEQKRNCNLKIFIKKDNEIINDDFKYNQRIDNSNFSDKDISVNDFSDVAPPIGNSLFSVKDLEIDSNFKLLQNNINKEKKLLLSIYEIKKVKNNIYIYEFIATSNQIYNLGDNRIEFYGVQKMGNDKLYFSKIKVINNISCSIHVNSICQFKDKYLCIGLQNHNLKGQISGFALIDIYNRDICRIIRDQEISCLYFSLESNLLIASMEVRDIKNNYFMTKIYKITTNVGDKGDKEIDLKRIYQFKSGHNDTISSVYQLKTFFCNDNNTDSENINENLFYVTSSYDSSLEIIKTNIKA